MCREPVPRNTGNDQVGTRPRNVRDGTSNGVATTFLFRGSPRREMVLARGPQETPIFSEGVGRGAEGVEERGRHSEDRGRGKKNAEDTRKRRKPSGSARQSKEWKGALQKSAGRKAQGADEAGRVGIGSDEKGKFVVPTN